MITGLKSIAGAFFSYFYIAFVGISSAVFFGVAVCIRIITWPFDRRLILLNLFSSFWASVYLWCMPIWGVKITGRDKLDMSKGYVIVSNHQSQLDILLAYRLFFPFRWVSKREVFRLPFIGWNMFLNGYIPLKRGDKQSARNMMLQCEALLKNNISIVIFPEGTRSKTGIVKPFKPGAFIMAKNTKKPIVPIVINNTKDALPKHSLRLGSKTQMTLTVLDEIPYAGFKEKTIDQVSDMVRNRITAHVKEHQEMTQPVSPCGLTECP